MARSWYVVTLLMTSQVGDSDPGPFLCDEQIRLIRAADADEAYTKAIALGHAEEHSYDNADNVRVSWIFVGIQALEELTAAHITDGVEIKSRLFHDSHPRQLSVPKHALSLFSEKQESPEGADGY